MSSSNRLEMIINLSLKIMLLFQSGDSWQYLFCLKPRAEQNNKNLKQVTNIGKLDIVWRTGLCDR